MNSIVIIPALNPPEHLIFYVDELIESGAAERSEERRVGKEC